MVREFEHTRIIVNLVGGVGKCSLIRYIARSIELELGITADANAALLLSYWHYGERYRAEHKLARSSTRSTPPPPPLVSRVLFTALGPLREMGDSPRSVAALATPKHIKPDGRH